MQHYGPTLLKLSRLPIPVICAVNGAAAGVGCAIALAGDLVIAGKSAYFLQAFVNIGLVADGGASWILPRLVGKARAAETMLLGERVSAEKAADWGLIYKWVEDADLSTEARSLSERLADGPTTALGIMRRNLAAALQTDYPTAMLREAEGAACGRRHRGCSGGQAIVSREKKAGIQGRVKRRDLTVAEPSFESPTGPSSSPLGVYPGRMVRADYEDEIRMTVKLSWNKGWQSSRSIGHRRAMPSMVRRPWPYRSWCSA